MTLKGKAPIYNNDFELEGAYIMMALKGKAPI